MPTDYQPITEIREEYRGVSYCVHVIQLADRRWEARVTVDGESQVTLSVHDGPIDAYDEAREAGKRMIDGRHWR